MFLYFDNVLTAEETLQSRSIDSARANVGTAEPSAEWDELLPLLCWALDVEAQRNLGPSTERPVRFWMALIDR
jgi:hypothetical protein